MSEGLIGSGSMLGIGSESTYGTAVAAAFWTPVVRNTVKRMRETKQVPHLGGISYTAVNSIAPLQRDSGVLEDNVGGDIEFVPTFDHKSTSLLLVHCFGKTPTTAGAGPYTHTYTPGMHATASHLGATLRSLHGYHSSVNPEEVFEGCLVNSWEFAVKAGEFASISMNIIGETSGGLAAQSGTPIMVASEEIQGNHVGTLEWNSLSITMLSMKVKMDKKLSRRKQLGSLLTDKPQPTAPYEITFEAEIELTSAAGYAAYLASDQADGTITITGTSNNSLVITLYNMKLESFDKPIDRSGILVQRVMGRCYTTSAGTELGMKWVLTNNNASAVA